MTKEPKFEKLEFKDVPRSAIRKNNPVQAVTYGFFKSVNDFDKPPHKIRYYHKWFSAN